MKHSRLERAGLALIAALLPAFVVFLIAVVLLRTEWAFVFWALSFAISSSYLAAGQFCREPHEDGAAGCSNVAPIRRSTIDWELLLESLRYVKEKPQYHDRPPSAMFLQEQLERLDDTIDKVRSLRDGAQLT